MNLQERNTDIVATERLSNENTDSYELTGDTNNEGLINKRLNRAEEINYDDIFIGKTNPCQKANRSSEPVNIDNLPESLTNGRGSFVYHEDRDNNYDPSEKLPIPEISDKDVWLTSDYKNPR